MRDGALLLVQPATRAEPGSLPNWNSVSSLHIRCRITASLPATATRARAMPRALATFMPQARRLDHLRLRTSSVWAASWRAVRASSSPSADLARDVGLTGLVAGRRQPEMGAHVPRAPEALRPADRGPERQRG